MYRIGIDLGGTNIAAGLVNESYEIVRKKSVPTGAERPGEMIVADMAELCRDLCAEHGITLADVVAIGIASPGVANTNTGIVEYTNNLHFENFPIASILGENLGFKNIGLGTEAITELIRFGFEDLDLEEIRLVVFSHNERAIRCYNRLGFREYKRETDIARRNNQAIDDIYMRLRR